MYQTAKPTIAITIGDAAGIGPEIALKALANPAVYEQCKPILVGDAKVLQVHQNILGNKKKIHPVKDVNDSLFSYGVIDVIDTGNIRMDQFSFGAGNAMTGRAMIEDTERAVELALSNQVDAVIGCPHTKTAVEQAGIPFDGYPGLVARLTGTNPEEAFLMLVSGQLRVVNTTLHVPLREALDMIQLPLVIQSIRAAHHAVRKLGVEQPRIGVAGLNPHAGENGLMGKEEDEIIRPAIQKLRAEGLLVEGPVGSDTLFAEFGAYDVYVAMYHDQAHIAMKMRAPRQIAAMTIGTPVLFSSVGHGSAPDIAGKGLASANGLLETINLLSRVKGECYR